MDPTDPEALQAWWDRLASVRADVRDEIVSGGVGGPGARRLGYDVGIRGGMTRVCEVVGGWSVIPRRTRFRTRGQPKAGAMRELSASLTAVSPGAKSEVLEVEVKSAWVTTTRSRSGTTKILCPKLPLAE